MTAKSEKPQPVEPTQSAETTFTVEEARTHRVRVVCEGVTIAITDGQFHEVAKGVGELDTELKPGLYSVELSR